MVVPLQTGSESKARMPVGGTSETISRQNVCLYATYDEGLAADISRGDPEPTVNRLLVRHDPVGGRFGGRMVVDARRCGGCACCDYTARGRTDLYHLNI